MAAGAGPICPPVQAPGLTFLIFLIRDPISAVAPYRDGVLVQIPQPERVATHKLIVMSGDAISFHASRGRGQANAAPLARRKVKGCFWPGEAPAR
ncbi:GSU2403 family nucleotidyltransferase fold protein [Hyphococcus luteus]|uniref:Nucleotidyltransferase-like domain-containing protein n=1 Tax=Hyphococcus luteus TaxID=2058213 RepID=A0A2S7K9X7_9PROT|nr:hypothetical protein CW354_04755 [Marinicaulis flavus]